MSFPPRLSPILLLGLALTGPLACPLAARAESLLEDPPDITGVEPTPPGEFAITLGLGAVRDRSGPHRTTLGATLEIEAGIAPGVDLKLSQEFLRGRAGPRGSDATAPDSGGATALGLRWQIADEGDWRPALGLFGAIGTAYGQGRPTEEASLVALASRTLRDGERPLAGFLNAGWTARLDPEAGERPGRYLLAVGVAQSLAPETSLGLSYLREQQERGERDLNLVQAGLRHAVADGRAILGVTAGAGIGRDSPSWQVGFGVKWLIGGE